MNMTDQTIDPHARVYCAFASPSPTCGGRAREEGREGGMCVCVCVCGGGIYDPGLGGTGPTFLSRTGGSGGGVKGDCGGDGREGGGGGGHSSIAVAVIVVIVVDGGQEEDEED